jgi:hypothetical protein
MAQSRQTPRVWSDAIRGSEILANWLKLGLSAMFLWLSIGIALGGSVGTLWFVENTTSIDRKHGCTTSDRAVERAFSRSSKVRRPHRRSICGRENGYRGTCDISTKIFAWAYLLDPEAREKLFSVRRFVEDDANDAWLFLTSRKDQHAFLRPLLSLWCDQAAASNLSHTCSRKHGRTQRDDDPRVNTQGSIRCANPISACVACLAD